MTTINPVSTPNDINFKGISQNENGVLYHKSNTGLITGSIIGGLGALIHLNNANNAEITKALWETSGEKYQKN